MSSPDPLLPQTQTLPLPSAISPDDPSIHLEHRLETRFNDFLTALDSRNFYLELVLIVATLALAWLTTRWLHERIKKKLATWSPKFIDPEFITKPLLLLGPTFALVFLWVLQGFVTGLNMGGALTDGALELTTAYWLTQCVFMAIRFRPVALVVATAVVINAVLHALRVSRSTSAFLNSVSVDLGPLHFTALHLVHGIIIFVVVFWGAGILSQTLENYLRKGTQLSANTRHLTVKFIKILIYIIAIAITMSAVGIDITAFAIFSGALGVGIGLGLQKITANFVSGVTVMMERSIKIGDLIEIGGQTGYVRQLNIRYVLLETSDGREILIPNEELISTRVINWTLTTTMARIEIGVPIAYDNDAEKAKELLIASALEHSRCLRDPKPTCWIREFTDTGIHLALTFWISDVTQGRNGPQSDVMFTILKKFKDNTITMSHA